MFELNVIWFSAERPTELHMKEVTAKFRCKVNLVVDEGVALAKGYVNHTMSLLDICDGLNNLYHKYKTGITAGNNDLMRQFLEDKEYVSSFSMYEKLFNEKTPYETSPI